MFKTLLMRYIFVFLLSPMILSAQLPDSLLTLVQFPGISEQTKVSDLFIGQANRKLVATNNGLYSIRANAQMAEQIVAGDFQAVCSDRKDNIWSISNQTLFMQDEKIYSFKEKIDCRNMVCFKNNLWLATNKGVFKFNTNTQKLGKQYTARNSKLKSNDIRFVFADKNDQLWIGTAKGIVLIKSNKKWKLYEKQSSMESMAYNKEGLWLVADNAMWNIDPFGRWYDAAIDRGLKTGRVRDITTDRDGRLVLASDIMVRYNPYIDEIHPYDNALGAIAQLTNAIEGDANQDIWVGTSKGLFLVSFEDTKIETLGAFMKIEKDFTCKQNSTASIRVEAFGGKAPYKYKWAHSKVRSKKIRDLKAGTYNVTVSDKNSNTFTLSKTIVSPYPMKIEFTDIVQSTGPKTQDGSVVAKIQGGIGTYSYIWEDKSNSNSRTELNAGRYTLTVTDEKNCSTEASFELKPQKFIPTLDAAKLEVGKSLRIEQFYYQADSSDIQTQFYPILAEIEDFLVKNPTVVIEIGGHTNGIPPADICYKLSTARARKIAEHLFRSGISSDRIVYKGYGKEKPIATNETLAGRKKNQRVELKILKL